MKWVTRERPKTDRIACPWLIKNFIDAEAEFLYVPTEQVLEVAEREGAHSYDAPNAEYTHRDGLCSFPGLASARGRGSLVNRFDPPRHAGRRYLSYSRLLLTVTLRYPTRDEFAESTCRSATLRLVIVVA